ncbi:hypothetical protein [Clostridium paraputrificum]|uniref:hypothetical protein n=1 Tax=Clostridium paraputrificum TaxID=29363 RepID=UPI003561F054
MKQKRYENIVLITYIIFLTTIRYIGGSNILSLIVILPLMVICDILYPNKRIYLLIMLIFNGNYSTIYLFIVYLLIKTIFYIINSGKIEFDFNSKILLILYVYIILNSLMQKFMNMEYSLVQFMVFSLTFILGSTVYFILVNSRISMNDIKSGVDIFIKLCLYQIIPISCTMFIQVKEIGTIKIGDDYKGTFANAHIATLVMLVATIVLVVSKKKEFRFKILTIIMYSILMDGKHVYLGLIMSVLITVILLKISKKYINMLKKYVLIPIIFIFAITFISKIDISEMNLSKYIYDYNHNLRYSSIINLIDVMKFPRNIIGLGAGSYGSRASNALASDIMYKGEEQSDLPTIVSKYYYPIASRYDKDYVTRLRYHSAVLSYPFSSLLSIYAELGIIGSVICMVIIGKNYYYCNRESIPMAINLISGFIFSISLFDTYLERVEVLIILMIVLYISTMYKKEKSNGKNNETIHEE